MLYKYHVLRFYKMQKLYKIILGLGVTATLSQCAEPRALTGGERDKTPPALDSTRYSTPNKSLNFADKEVILTFNEWIQLDQAATKVVVSPALQQRPDIRIKRRSVVIKFKEDLRPNTTYTINMGDAVKDLSEGNAAKNLKFVFSTGTYLDSLQVTGGIIDARTGAAMPNITVMLYDELRDSMPLQAKPYYFARTDEQGSFFIENIKSDSFKIFALSDKNSNYILDAGEEIGFWQHDFAVTDSIEPQVQMRLFMPLQVTRATSAKFVNKGYIKNSLNQAVKEQPTLTLLNPPTNYKQYAITAGDSMQWWIKGGFEPETAYKWAIQFPNQTRIDTANLTFYKDLAEIPKFGLMQPSAAGNKAASKRGDAASGKQHPNKPLFVQFAMPAQSIDTSRVKLCIDSACTQTQPFTYNLDTANLTRLEIQTAWKSDKYKLVFYPSSIIDFYNRPTTDTLTLDIQVGKPEEYGNLTVLLQEIDTAQTFQYIVQLVRGKDEILNAQTIETANRKSIKLDYQMLEAGSYTIQIIEDINRNGQWDTGDYWTKRQPERIFNSKPSTVRGNWDNELEFFINPPKKDKLKDKKSIK